MQQSHGTNTITAQSGLIRDQTNLASFQRSKIISLQHINTVQHIRRLACSRIRRSGMPRQQRRTRDCPDATNQRIHKPLAIGMHAVAEKQDEQISRRINPDSGASKPTVTKRLRRHQIAAI